MFKATLILLVGIVLSGCSAFRVGPEAQALSQYYWGNQYQSAPKHRPTKQHCTVERYGSRGDAEVTCE